MSSPDRSRTKNKGKGVQKHTEASGSSTAANSHPDGPWPAVGNQMSIPLPNQAAEKHISQWLDGTQTASKVDSPSTQNQENVKCSCGVSTTASSDSKKEYNALASRPLRNLKQPGTSAPANTPQSGDNGGHISRSLSTGDADGRRPHIGTRANTADGAPLPICPITFFPAIPQSARFKLRTEETSVRSDDINTETPDFRSSPMGMPSSLQVLREGGNITGASSSASHTMAISAMAGCPKGTSPSEINIGDNSGIVPNSPKHNQNPHPLAAQSAPVHPTGKSPSPPISWREALHTVPSPAASPRVVVTEQEMVQHSHIALPQRHIETEGHGNDAQDRTAPIVHPKHPESRLNRIKRDLKQLYKDLFSRTAHRMSTIKLQKEPPTLCENEGQKSSLEGDDFEKEGDLAHQGARIASPSDILVSDAVALPKTQPKGASPTATSEGTANGESSNTARGGGRDGGVQVDTSGLRKTFFQRLKKYWPTKERRGAAARGVATVHRGALPHQVHPDAIPSFQDTFARPNVIAKKFREK